MCVLSPLAPSPPLPITTTTNATIRSHHEPASVRQGQAISPLSMSAWEAPTLITDHRHNYISLGDGREHPGGGAEVRERLYNMFMLLFFILIDNYDHWPLAEVFHYWCFSFIRASRIDDVEIGWRRNILV